MGYDLTIKREKDSPKYHRWFNIWNWHRCLVLTLTGMGAIDSTELEKHLMGINDLEHGHLSEEDRAGIKEAVKKSGVQNEGLDMLRKDDPVKYVILLDPVTDVQGRIMDINIQIPNKLLKTLTDVDEEEAEVQKTMTGIWGSAKAQTMTNHVLFDTKAYTGFGNRTCVTLSSNQGLVLERNAVKAIAVGMQVALSRFNILGDDFLDGLAELLSIEPNTLDELKRLSKSVHKQSEHEDKIELDELWDPTEFHSIAKFFGMFMQAASEDNEIIIT
jgi:hypothetical protein